MFLPKFCRTSAWTLDGSVDGLELEDAPLEGESISLAFSKIACVLQRRLKCNACRLVGRATADLLPKKAVRPVAMLATLAELQDSILIDLLFANICFFRLPSSKTGALGA